jgi:phosphohistidine phosphatase SixA
VAVFLVRHAKAGSRSDWNDDDVIRPLSKKGWAQARALAELISPHQPVALLSSPYLRCQQTLEPLADMLALPVTDHDSLTEGSRFEDAIELLHSVQDGTVLCSHGDIIPAVIDALVRRGMSLLSDPDLRKAATFVLHRDGNHFVSAHCWAPPGL